ncbi:PI-PLC X domain-containing protein 1-like [Pyxicephalus adspersus]|uniref:PI-PLC X domain-containing protein 1-like n=1 Tax=Pyxicephalus adspersus TaxID=30357 RepID=UPI003B5AEB02
MENFSEKSDTEVSGNQQWMSQLSEQLWDIPLYNLSIPGSHDTMTYCLDRCSPIDPESPKLLLFLAKYVPSITRKIILRWSTTQFTSNSRSNNKIFTYVNISDGFFVAGLNLTENVSYILKHPFGSMKKLTLPKLPFLNSWVEKQYPGDSKDATNIIAEDLIGSGQFVPDVVDLNNKLLLDKN